MVEGVDYIIKDLTDLNFLPWQIPQRCEVGSDISQGVVICPYSGNTTLFPAIIEFAVAGVAQVVTIDQNLV